MLEKSCFALTKTEGPSSDEFVFEELARENSGLRRSYISDTSNVRKIVKICSVEDIGSGAPLSTKTVTKNSRAKNDNFGVPPALKIDAFSAGTPG